jgi:hypothetical protein
MYEIKSCGTTIDFTSDHFQASSIYDRCCGPVVQMYRYNSSGGKFLIAEKMNHHRVAQTFPNGVSK